MTRSLSLLAALAVVVGCGGSTPSGPDGGSACTPGQPQDCGGAGDCPGQRVCAADGRSYGACQCAAGGSSGSGTSGGSSAASTATTGASSGSTGQGSTAGGSGGATSSQASSGGSHGSSGGSSAGATNGGSSTGGPVPPVSAPPQVVDLGGPVLTAAKVQLIAYTEDPFVSDVEAFITEFGTTTEWATQTGEYGVGPFTVLPTILVPGTPPMQLDDDSANSATNSPFEQTLAANISGATPAWAPEDGSTMYVFLLPLGTDISSSGDCCSDFLGYHYEAALSSGEAPYAIVCHCAAQSGDPVTPLQYVTTTVSHEMVETATDPFFLDTPAYAQSDNADAIWTIATGGEIADMCEYNTDSNYQPPGATYMLQRSWSDAAADAGTNPCVPVPATGPYFNSYPVLSDPITLNYGGPWPTNGVSLGIGQTATIDVVLASTGPTAGPWTVTAWDINDYLGVSPRTTTVSLDQTTGSDGDVLHLTITVDAYDPSFAGAGFVLESTLNGQDNLSIGAVGQ